MKQRLTQQYSVSAWVFLILAATCAHAETPAVVGWPYDDSLARPMIDLLKGFQSGHSSKVAAAGIADMASIGRFADGDEPFGVVCCAGAPTAREKELLARMARKYAAEPEMRRIGYRGIAIVVNEASSVRNLSLTALGKILSSQGKGITWSAFGGGNSAVRCYVESKKAWPMTVLQHKCMAYEEQVKGYVRSGWLEFRDDLDENSDVAEIIRKVRADRNGIGCFRYTGQAIKGVRLVAIAETDAGPFRAMAEGTVFNDGYVLAEPLMLYIHPKAPRPVRDFCDYAGGIDGSAILEGHGVITPCRRWKAESDARLADMKSGKGIRLSAIGIVGCGKAVPDLAIEYVKAKAVVQLGYAATDSDVAAVGAFARAGAGATTMPAEAGGSAAPTSMPTTAPVVVAPMTPFVAAGGKELLFLADKPSVRAMELHGQKWNALGSASLTTSGSTSLTTSGRDPASPNDGYTAASKPGQPNGTGPAEYLLAGRAAAVVVNPANKIDALTIGQLQAIFGGEVEDWGTLGSTSLTTSGNSKSQIGGSQIKGSQIAGSQIKPYGLRGDDPATGIFEKECLDRYKWRRVVVKKDTAEVLAAVSMDPQAIGFVDLAAIPATGQNVRILGIRLPGRGGPAAPPPALGATSPRGGGVAERAGGAPPPAFAEATAGRPALGATSPRGGGVYLPTPENIKSAMYPLSQRLWLYVHPQASDTARDFVKFIATCGGSTSLTAGASSEASSYADTVKAVMDTYRKHGLVPLADAALVRMVKDAMAEAAARAKADAATPKPKGKERK